MHVILSQGSGEEKRLWQLTQLDLMFAREKMESNGAMASAPVLKEPILD